MRIRDIKVGMKVIYKKTGEIGIIRHIFKENRRILFEVSWSGHEYDYTTEDYMTMKCFDWKLAEYDNDFNQLLDK